MRDNIEDVLYDHKVDIVLTGHVHPYDRTTSVYKNRTTCDGPVYITIGDGGNHEGPYPKAAFTPLRGSRALT